MKRKSLFAIVALLCSVGMWAGTDVTASYIGNLDSFAGGGWEGSCGNNHKESNGIGWWNTQSGLSGGHSFRNGESWCPNVGSAGVMMGRTMVLPSGNYTLSFKAYGATSNNATDKTAPAAGDIKAFFSGSATKYDVTNTTLDDATYHDVSYTFDVTTDNTVYTFGIEKMSDGSKANWGRIKDVTLTLNSTDITPIANNDVSPFTYDGDQTWHTNTWSVEGQSDGTRFQVPFHELWVGSGNTLHDANITGSFTPSQTGVYKVSAWVRALNESGGAISGAKIFVGDTEADACGGSAITNGSLGTFTAMADGVSGTPISYGFKIASATINWLSFKNVTITYLGSLPSAEVDALLAQVPSGKMAASIKTELDSRVSALESVASVANYNSLASYIATANASVIDYANLATAISNAESYTTYKPAFSASETIYQAGITAAQAVYDDASANDCTATIAALTTAIQNANVNDYNIYTDGTYEYSYSSLLDVDMTNWTTTDWALMTGNEHWNGETSQSYYEQTSAEWGSSSWSHSGSETVTLPAGNYVMGIIARASAPVTSTMSVTVGDNTPITTTLTHKGSTGKGITTAGVASFNSGTFANTNGRGWEYRFIAFTVAEDNTDVTINVSASASAVHNWVSLTNPLLKGDVHPNQIYVNRIASLLSTLEGYESLIHDDTYDTFSSDITAAEAATTADETSALTGIISDLTTDIATASAMYSKMTTIADNKGDITSWINGDFQTNADGWTGGTHVTWCATQSWKGGDGNKYYERSENGNMSYTVSSMPSGTYKLVAAARTYDGGKIKAQVAGGSYGSELTGTGASAPADGTMEINTNGVEMPYSSLGGFTSDASGHNWHWITATGTLAADGDLVINFTATGSSWMAIDDVHLYCTSLDETSYTRTVGDGKGTINTSSSVVTADIIMENPNTILRSTGKVTTAAGQELNNNQYNSSRITKLVLYDGYDFTNSGDNYGLDNGATLYRNIPADTWCTLMVPFYPTNLDDMKVTASLIDNVLTFEDAPSKDMNDAPMLVKSTAGVTAITGLRNSTYGIDKGDNTSGAGAIMTGTYSAIDAVPTGSYVVARKNDADNLYKVNSTVTLAPFRAYFTVAGAGVKANILTLNFDGEATAIRSIDNEQSTMGNAVIYNLAGQRMSKMQKGVNIVNGKKVLVK